MQRLACLLSHQKSCTHSLDCITCFWEQPVEWLAIQRCNWLLPYWQSLCVYFGTFCTWNCSRYINLSYVIGNLLPESFVCWACLSNPFLLRSENLQRFLLHVMYYFYRMIAPCFISEFCWKIFSPRKPASWTSKKFYSHARTGLQGSSCYAKNWWVRWWLSQEHQTSLIRRTARSYEENPRNVQQSKSPRRW